MKCSLHHSHPLSSLLHLLPAVCCHARSRTGSVRLSASTFCTGEHYYVMGSFSVNKKEKMSQGVVSSPENLPGNKAYSDLLSWPHTIVYIYISSQPLLQPNVTASKKQQNKHQKDCSGSDLSRNELSGVFHRWLSQMCLSMTDLCEPVIQHRWIRGFDGITSLRTIILSSLFFSTLSRHQLKSACSCPLLFFWNQLLIMLIFNKNSYIV